MRPVTIGRRVCLSVEIDKRSSTVHALSRWSVPNVPAVQEVSVAVDRVGFAQVGSDEGHDDGDVILVRVGPVGDILRSRWRRVCSRSSFSCAVVCCEATVYEGVDLDFFLFRVLCVPVPSSCRCRRRRRTIGVIATFIRRTENV